MYPRITAFAVQPTGARNFGFTVRGIRVLVTADEDNHEAGRLLAEAIAALGPEAASAPEPPPAPVPAIVEKPAAQPAAFQVGQPLWCTVHGAEGVYHVTEVGSGRNHGRIQVRETRGWCPAHNFRSHTD